MIQFHLSKDAMKDLAIHAQEKQPINPQALQWYLHGFTLGRRKCIIAMELQSRYATVFCGLTKREFGNFPEIFAERFWREAMLVLDFEYGLDNRARSELTYWCQEIAARPYFQPGHDRSVHGHITDILSALRAKVEYQGYPVPVDEMDAISFGIHINQTPRRSKNHPDWFFPIKEYRQFWAGLLERVCGISLQSHSDDDAPLDQIQSASDNSQVGGSNVVQVDFSKGRKR